MSPPSLASPALACMQEIQRQCFALGIPLKTRHREVAPNQYEFAPLYGSVTTQIDQNLMVMQIIEEVATTFGLAALLQEKPFQVQIIPHVATTIVLLLVRRKCVSKSSICSDCMRSCVTYSFFLTPKHLFFCV
jgi:hypothetical protein